ncbi:MAG: hypothetical protein ABW040_05215 [Microbacteriaceae bacterium]
MVDIFVRMGRLLAARWPALLAWFLAGWLARYLLIELAGQVGSVTAVGGFLLLPLAALARLLSYVAMFLVLRDEMPGYQRALATGAPPVDLGASGRRRAAVDVTLACILPFFAFYAAWKLLRDDVIEYSLVALDARVDDIFLGRDIAEGGVVDLRLSVVTGAIIVVAYLGRLVLKRAAGRLPKWTSLLAVYLEAVWVYFFVSIVGTYLTEFRGWVDTRQAMVWIAELRAGLAETVAPLAVAWDGVEWVIAELSGLVLLPLAWLTLAGVILGRALARASGRPRLLPARLEVVQRTWSRVPGWLARRLRDVGADWVGRWRPLADALVLIWRAGPIGLGLYVLAYTLLLAAGGWIARLAALGIGPQEVGWWRALDAPFLFVIAVIIEPLRIVLIAAAYDYCLEKLEQRRAQEQAASADLSR